MDKAVMFTAFFLFMLMFPSPVSGFVELDDIKVTLGLDEDDFERGRSTNNLRVDGDQFFYVFIFLEPDESEDDVSFVVDVFFDDILVVDNHVVDGLELMKDLDECDDCLIILDVDDFDYVWVNRSLSNYCGSFDVDVNLHGGDLDEIYSDSADLKIQGRCYDGTLALKINSSAAGENTTISVTDKRSSNPVEDVLVEVYRGSVLWSNRLFGSSTADDGMVSFVVEEPGTYIVTGKKKDYLSAEEKVILSRESLTSSTTTSKTTTTSTSSTSTSTSTSSTTSTISTSTTTTTLIDSTPTSIKSVITPVTYETTSTRPEEESVSFSPDNAVFIGFFVILSLAGFLIYLRMRSK